MRQMFANREEAGDRLAEVLVGVDRDRLLVLGLAPGGVPVAERVAHALGGALDALVVHRVPSPRNPDRAIGAVTAAGPAHFERASLDVLGLSEGDLEGTVASGREEVRRRETAYRGSGPGFDIEGMDVIVVDDALVNGMSARAALTALRERSPASLVLAAPVGEQQAVRSLSELCDQVVCLMAPDDFQEADRWYGEYPHVADDSVRSLLGRS